MAKQNTVASFRFDQDPRFVDLGEKVDALKEQQSTLRNKLIDATARLRQVQTLGETLNVKILLGEATEQDAQSARAEGDRINEEMTALRGAMAIGKERMGAAEAAQATLTATLKAECHQRAMIAYRATVDRLKPLLLEAARLNRELFQVFEFVNLPGVPGPFHELRLNDDRLNTKLGYWLTEAETFKWKEHGA